MDRIEQLELHVKALQNHIALIEQVDESLEEAILHRWPLATTMSSILDPARTRLGAGALLIRTFNENNQRVDYMVPDEAAFNDIDVDALCAEVERQNTLIVQTQNNTITGYRLDVSDVYLGTVLMLTDPSLTPQENQSKRRALQLWSEQLDNYLAAISQARRKHQALQELSEALRVPILDEGLDHALRILKRYVPYKDIALVLQYEEQFSQNTINTRVVAHGQWYDTNNQSMPSQSVIAQFIKGDILALQQHHNLSAQREAAVMMSADGHAIVGRISVGLEKDTHLTPFGRDILDRFADYIRLRIVDFSKEWKDLSGNFPQPIVRRLLQEASYYDAYLSPRERDVAIMFCDISGFTHLSEQVLREPTLIGQLINTWSEQVVEYIWQTGGVFDKMVGDCIIGLWGPPFFDIDADQACRAAADAAILIRDYTKSLQHQPALANLTETPWQIGVSTGLNYCPLFVGTFGPDENYTGFSSGMNNTARLQGVASCDDILCMENFVQAFGDDARFSEKQVATVKNVKAPLQFRTLHT